MEPKYERPVGLRWMRQLERERAAQLCPGYRTWLEDRAAVRTETHARRDHARDERRGDRLPERPVIKIFVGSASLVAVGK